MELLGRLALLVDLHMHGTQRGRDGILRVLRISHHRCRLASMGVEHTGGLRPFSDPVLHVVAFAVVRELQLVKLAHRVRGRIVARHPALCSRQAAFGHLRVGT